jgi:hypothetical protein
MRTILPALVLAAMAASTQAASIETIATGKDSARSIERIRCDSCSKAAPKKVQAVVELAPGTQKVEIRDVDGVKKVYRTEAWLGGSPVVVVSKMIPPEDKATAEAEGPATSDVAAAPADSLPGDQPVDKTMIDEKATTSAVTADLGAEAKVAPKTPAFDPSKLELRVN